MSLLLAPDLVELYRPGDLDAHGWREEPPEDSRPYWCGKGNLQLLIGASSPAAAGAGGQGPHGPATIIDGTLYLPPEVVPVEGSTAVVRGSRYVLSQVRLIADPLAGTEVECVAATATVARDG